tara:strand:+ start:183 stop:917 length:735 start_codon:yes stop_codon:yes gene_type:complete
VLLPKITILIPNYNDAEYIGKAIESGLNQDYSGDITICVVDDGSTDDSWKIISSYFGDRIGEFGSIKVIGIKNENSGPSGARNAGIEQTIGDTDIYAMLDSDDEMYPDKISNCVSLFTDSSIGVVYGDYDVFHTSTNKIIREFKEPYSRKRLVNECIVHSGSMVSSEALKYVLEDTGYYDKTMRTCEDYDLWMRISEKYMIRHVPKSLTLVRVTGDNSSFIVNKEVWAKNWTKVMQKRKNRLNG